MRNVELYGLPEVLGDYKETSHEPMKHEDGAHIMLVTKKLFDANGIRFVPFYGTLLGMIREHGFIPHDFDLDLIMWEKDREKLIKLIPEFEKEGVKLVRCVQPWVYTFVYGTAQCDFNPIQTAPWYLRWRYIHVEEKYLRKDFFEKTEKCEFLGKQFDVPANPIKVLKFLYGKTWNIPQKGKRAHIEPYWMVHKRIIKFYQRCVRYARRHWFQTLKK